jgi:hypothetical protein
MPWQPIEKIGDGPGQFESPPCDPGGPAPRAGDTNCPATKPDPCANISWMNPVDKAKCKMGMTPPTDPDLPPILQPRN